MSYFTNIIHKKATIINEKNFYSLLTIESCNQNFQNRTFDFILKINFENQKLDFSKLNLKESLLKFSNTIAKAYYEDKFREHNVKGWAKTYSVHFTFLKCKINGFNILNNDTLSFHSKIEINLKDCKLDSITLDENHFNFLIIGKNIKAQEIIIKNCSKIELSNFNFEVLDLSGHGYIHTGPYELFNGKITKRFFYKVHQLSLKLVDLKSASKSDLVIIRKLKNKFQEEGNTYDFLNTVACEQRIIRKKLPNYKIGEHIQLVLNDLSNVYNTSWTRGILFTLITNFIGSVWLLWEGFKALPFSIYGINSSLVKIFFNNFSPLYKYDFLEKVSASNLSYFILFLNKVAVFYGVYQTVQAFRKFRK